MDGVPPGPGMWTSTQDVCPESTSGTGGSKAVRKCVRCGDEAEAADHF